MKVAIYIRVSTKKQDETNQLPCLREMAKNRGFEIFREYSDEASAKDFNRPGWRDLMQDAKEHKFDAILVTKLDRVMRSLVQLNITMTDLQSYNVKLISADIGEIDFTTPKGKVQMQIIGAIAEWEREIIVQRTREGIEARKAKGVHLGRKRRDESPLIPSPPFALPGTHGNQYREISVFRRALYYAEGRRLRTSSPAGP
jgi:DNA invertase Pin-like site-specific DNA recombinase